jgi:hypothetical protein
MTAVLETPTPAGPIRITQPGVYDIPADTYHRDPVPAGSLSSTGARKLLTPSCPAKFRWDQTHPQPPKDEFDLGTAAHKLVLGNGPNIVKVDADSWRTNAAKDKAMEIRDEGGVPLLPREYEQVHAMAAALHKVPLAAALLAAHTGQAEQSLFWIDQETGVWCRARPDWLPTYVGDRVIVADYKSAHSAEPEKFSRSVLDFGYHQQADWYLGGMRALGLGSERNAFLFIVQEKTPPYVVSVIGLAEIALMVGRSRNRKALELYRDCSRSGVWPGYTDDEPVYVSLPPWAEREAWDELA